MMKKNLPQAIALAASLGMAASAHAVNVNQDGLGEVLLYPIYTVEGDNVTTVHVTNTTNAIKAVKVRFVEGMNSQEVLDFNLYLSPFDVWTGAVVRTATGASLVTEDKSCTAGAIPAAGEPFKNFLYQGDAEGLRGTDRARVGHIEVIEMGVVDSSFPLNGTTTAGAAIIHGANGEPGDCGAVRTALSPGGVWRGTGLGDGVSAPTGGLYGTSSVINVADGTQVGVDATALDNFSSVQLHKLPGDEAPSLADADPVATFKNGTSDTYSGVGIDAVSAVLMKENIKNDYAVGAGLNAETDFVITFPTKRLYVNNGFTAGEADPATPPFLAGWNRSNACEVIDVRYYDREERTAQLTDEQFSPRPPEQEGISLCYETNILGISGSNVLGGEFVRTNFELNSGFDLGWININMTTNADGDTRLLEGDTADLVGLPAIGFAITKIENGDTGTGVLNNYAGSWNHKALTSFDTAN